MNYYKGFNVDNWIEDPKFQKWVYDNRDQEFWENYLLENPDQATAIHQAKGILLSIAGSKPKKQHDEVKAKVGEIVSEIVDTTSQPVRVPLWRNRWVQMAASISMFLGLSWLVYLEKDPVGRISPYFVAQKPLDSSAYQEVLNDGKTSKLVNLPDGSVVVLQSKSRVRFEKAFDKNIREVYLLGEAFFEVKKNPGQPFFVYANELVTKVLGTSFSVRAYEEDNVVSVCVKSGRVSVFAQGKAETDELAAGRTLKGLVLTSNQQADLTRSNLEIIKSIVEKPELLSIPIETQDFSFKRTPVTQVFEVLEKAYGVKIIYDEELISKCSITANLADEPLFEKLNMIVGAMDATYESIDGQIVVNAHGCE